MSAVVETLVVQKPDTDDREAARAELAVAIARLDADPPDEVELAEVRMRLLRAHYLLSR